MPYYVQMSSGELYHHGILGQKWGQRNGPPYPLGANAHSAREKKDGWRQSLHKNVDAYKTYAKAYQQAEKNYLDKKVPKRREDESRLEYAKRAYKQIYIDDKAALKSEMQKAQDEYFNTVFSNHPNIVEARKKLADFYRDETTQKVLKGMVLVACTGVLLYTVKELQVSRAVDRSMAVRRLSSQFSKIPISQLSGNVDILPAEQTLQRLVRVPKTFTGRKSNLELVKEKEADWDRIYATFKKNDNRIYQAVFNMRGQGVPVISTRKTTQELVGASERQRVMTFMSLFNTSPEFREGFVQDMGWAKSEIPRLDSSHSRQYYKQFSTMLGKADSKTAPIYFNKLKEKGYDFLIDDNDAHGLGNSPVIILNAASNTMITGARAIKDMDRIISTILINPYAIRH